MATLAELHTALKTRLATVTTLTTADHPKQGMIPPLAFPELVGWQPIAMGRKGRKTYLFNVFVFTSQSVDPSTGYSVLMEYADSTGAKSIDVAIWDGNDFAAGTFNSLADTSAAVQSFRVLGAEEIDAFQMYGGLFVVEAETKAS